MGERAAEIVGIVGALRRYPVKSMLGEPAAALTLGPRGAAGDRAWAVIDTRTGKIASAKRPNPWRGLLGCSAWTLDQPDGAAVEVRLPDGTTRRAGDPALDAALSALTGHAVRLAAVPPAGAALDRSHPEAVLSDGSDADVGSDLLVLGGGAPPGTFMDYAPLHVLTTATLDGLSAALDDGPVEPARYRANIVIRSAPGNAAFPENGWVGGTLSIGETVVLRVILSTPRCAVPVLAHGMLPPRPGALRAAVARNRIEIEWFGHQPCAGVYASVASGGAIREGDAVTFRPAMPP